MTIINSKRNTKITTVLILFCLMAIIFSIFFTSYNEIKKFRKTQTYNQFYTTFNTPSVKNYIKRFFFLRKGSKIYNNTVIGYIKTSPSFSDDFINNYLIKKYFLDLSNSKFINLINYYPFENSIEIKNKIQISLKLFFNSNNDVNKWLDIFFKSEDKKDNITLEKELEEQHISETNHKHGIHEKYVSSEDNFELEIKEFKNSLYYKKYNQEKRLNELLSLISKFNLEREFFDYILKYKLDEEDIDIRILKSIDLNNSISEYFFNKLINAPYSYLKLKIILNYIFSENKHISNQAWKYLENNIDRLTNENIFSIIELDIYKDKKLYTKLFSKIKNNMYYTKTKIFKDIAHQDILIAEELAKAYINNKEDSSLKKGLIVILINHDSSFANSIIDLVFTGVHKRIELFHASHHYIHTDAAREYESISKHNYKKIGKAFPPIYCSEPDDKEVEKWKIFINKYPWFPGTDDAYYRLAFRQFIDKNLIEAEETINQYMNREFTDNDVKDYMDTLSTLIHIKKTSTSNKLSFKAFNNIDELYHLTDCEDDIIYDDKYFVRKSHYNSSPKELMEKVFNLLK